MQGVEKYFTNAVMFVRSSNIFEMKPDNEI